MVQLCCKISRNCENPFQVLVSTIVQATSCPNARQLVVLRPFHQVVWITLSVLNGGSSQKLSIELSEDF